jgi:tRNA threonylcarbamoyladenosine biosynthesis protein TsaE
MLDGSIEYGLVDESDLTALARHVGPNLDAGDVILLDGPVGAGKTAFARALIQNILLEPEDVPSPTFTLVQTYETTRGPLWHCDLYRLASAYEIEELGVYEAFQAAICLIEWPDILGSDACGSALRLNFEMADTKRILKAEFSNQRWKDLLRD